MMKPCKRGASPNCPEQLQIWTAKWLVWRPTWPDLPRTGHTSVPIPVATQVSRWHTFPQPGNTRFSHICSASSCWSACASLCPSRKVQWLPRCLRPTRTPQSSMHTVRENPKTCRVAWRTCPLRVDGRRFAIVEGDRFVLCRECDTFPHSFTLSKKNCQSSTQFSPAFDHLCERKCGEAASAMACGPAPVDTAAAASPTPISSTLSLCPAVSSLPLVWKSHRCCSSTIMKTNSGDSEQSLGQPVEQESDSVGLAHDAHVFRKCADLFVRCECVCHFFQSPLDSDREE